MKIDRLKKQRRPLSNKGMLAISTAVAMAGSIGQRSAIAGNQYFSDAGGATKTWDAGTTPDWSSTSNGTYGSVYANSSYPYAYFEGTGGNVNVSGTVNSNGIQFSVTGYNLSGGTIGLGNPGNETMTVVSGATATINSNISEPYAGMIFTGGGTLNLGGSNTFPYAITLNTGALVVTGGSDSMTSGNFVLGGTGVSSLTQTGGTITAGTGVTAYFGNALAGPTTLNMSGGSTTISGPLFLSVRGNGMLNISGAETFTAAVVDMTYASSALGGAGTINLGNGTAGGTLAVTQIAEGGTSGSTFNFSGGTLQAATGASSSAFFTGVTTANVLAGGAIIDTKGQTITIGQALLHGSSLGSTPDGGLTKLDSSGTGTLVLTGANTYTGTTTISSGTLQIGNGGTTGSLGTGAVVDNAALAFNINSGGNANLPAAGITGTGSVTAQAGFVYLSGNVTTSGSQSYTGLGTGSTYQGILIQSNDTLTTTGAGSSITLSGDAGNLSSTSGDTLALNTSAGNGPINLNISLGRYGVFYVPGSFSANAGTGAVNVTGTGNATGSGATSAGWRCPVTLTGAINISGNVNSISAITLNSTANGSVTGIISGSASLTSGGTAKLTLSASNTYTGSTTVNGGTLVAGALNTLSPYSAVNVSAGTLDVSGFNQTIPGLTVSSAGTLSTSAGVVLTDTGTASFNGTLNIAGTPASLPYTLISYTSETGSFNIPNGITSGETLFYGATALQLVVAPASITWNDTGGSPVDGVTWDDNHYQNWNNGTGPSVFSNSRMDNVTFSDNNNGNYNVTINSVLTPGSTTFNSAGNYNLSGSGGIGGVGGLTLTGTGTVNLATSNTFTGNTNVAAGTLNLQNSLALQNSMLVSGGVTFDAVVSSNAFTLGGISGSGNILLQNTAAAPIALSVGSSNASTGFTGVLSGSGSLVKMGVGILTMSASNTYTGGTTLGGGVFNLAIAENLGVSGPLGEIGPITFVGGTLQYSFANQYDYSTRFSQAAGQTFNIDTNGQNVTFAGPLNGSGSSLNKIGTGTLTLLASSSYTGGTNISAGTLSISADNQLGTAPSSPTTNLTLSGATLAFGGPVTLNANRSLVITGASTIDLVSNASSYGGAISGTGALTFANTGNASAGALTYTGTDTATGNTVIPTGTLTVGAGGSLNNTAGGITSEIALGTTTSTGSTVNNTLNITGGIVTTGQFYVAGVTSNATTAQSTLNVSSGSLTVTGTLFVLGDGSNGSTGMKTAQFTQTGGTVSVTNASVSIFAGNDTGGVTELDISGGTFTSAGEMFLGVRASSTLNISNSAIVTLPLLSLGYSTSVTTSTATNTVDLGDGTNFTNGSSGILVVGSVGKNLHATGTGGTDVLNFNGGTIQASASNANFISQLDTVAVMAGGGTIDNGGFNITIPQVINTGVVSGTDGGMKFQGLGVTTLSINNGYSGSTQVSAGTLVTTTDGALPAGNNVAVSTGATLVLPDQTAVSSVNAINLNGNLIVHSGNLATLSGAVASSYNSNWNIATGISSSAAASDTTHLHALGVIQNDDGTGHPLYPTFENQNVSDTDVLIKYTYYGDANLDGKVDGSDYSRIDFAALNNQNLSNTPLTGWFNGDFNYDGVIDGSDYTLLDNAFNTQGAAVASLIASPAAVSTAEIAGTSAVPEPTTLSVVAIGGIGLLSRRKRKNV